MKKIDLIHLSYSRLKFLCEETYKSLGYIVEYYSLKNSEFLLLNNEEKLLFIVLLVPGQKLQGIKETACYINALREVGEELNCFNYRIIAPGGFSEKAFPLEEYNVILSDWKYLKDLKESKFHFDLFPHNDLAYRKIKQAFQHSNRVAAIKPTGTGKSVLISRFLFDVKDEKTLILAPSNFIIDQIKKHIDWENKYTFLTYARTMFLSLKEIKNINPKVIILDEFHRCGAEEWGKGVNLILKQHSSSNILGTTATPIRYLDNARNMAEELFDGNVAVNLSLNRAIIEKILPTPKYISALYTLDEEVESLAEQIKNSNSKDKENLLNRLNQSRLDWEKAKGIPQIIQKHVPIDVHKIIVFTKNIDHLQQMKENVGTWFKEAGFENAKSYTVYSGNTENNKIFKEFEVAETGCLHLLFAVDMLNEGIHVKGVDGEIMLRPTESKTIFYQQLGRSLTVDFEKQPFILDLVNNFKNVRTKEFINDYNLEKEKATNNEFGIKDYAVSFSIIDETKEITELFDSFTNSIDSFNIFLKRLKGFKNEFGHTNVPDGYKDQWLSTKVRNVRYNYNKNIIPPYQIRLLNELGFVWSVKENQFQDLLKELVSFKQKYGHLDISRQKLSVNHYRQVKSLIKQHENGKLSKNKIDALNNIGFNFPEALTNEELFLKRLLSFYEKHGHVRVPRSFEDKFLAIKVTRVRKAYKDGVLDEKLITRLNHIGFVWEAKGNRYTPHYILGQKEKDVFYYLNRPYPRGYYKFLGRLIEFEKVYGHTRVPRTFKDKFLATKTSRVRKAYIEGKLDQKLINALNKIGFVWNARVNSEINL